MTMQWQAVDNVEPIADNTIEAIANMAWFNVVSGCAATYSASDMVKTIASGVVTVGNVVTSVAGNTVTLVSDPTNPRWTYTYINSSGVAAIVSGDPAATPSVPETGDTTVHSLDYVQAGLTVANDATYKIDKRVPSPPNPDIATASQIFVEMSGERSFFALGAASGGGTAPSSGGFIGLGFQFLETGSGAADEGAGGQWVFNAGASSGDDAGVIGPLLNTANDWTLVGRLPWPAGDSSTTQVLGAQASNSSFANANNCIMFRQLATGNIFGVCDSGGTETTRDTGISGDGSGHTFRIEVREGGTVVRFYADDVQVGADVTTNIPSANLYIAAGAEGGGGNQAIQSVADLFGWREN